MSVLPKRSYKPADERREQILDCALRVFAERGYHGASVADICARAGIGRATLYLYFDDKRDVLVALADRIGRRVIDAVARRPRLELREGFVPDAERAVRFVEERLLGVLRAAFDDEAAARLVLRAGRGADGVVDELLARIDDAVLGAVEDELRDAQRAGVVRPLDARVVARFFLGGIEKVVLAHLEAREPLDLAHVAREAARVELLGILAPAARERPPEPARGGRPEAAVGTTRSSLGRRRGLIARGGRPEAAVGTKGNRSRPKPAGQRAARGPAHEKEAFE